MKWLWRIGAVVLSLGIAQIFVYSTYIVENTSMLPAFRDGDIVVVSKLSDIERGDVVVVNAQRGFYTSNRVEFVIKRVIALGEDRIACCNPEGLLMLNGKPLSESYIKGKPSDISFDVTLPPDTVWLMGDNRLNSLDSRDLLGLPGGGAVSTQHIIGEVVWVLWRS